jgi:hypothetical protein
MSEMDDIRQRNFERLKGREVVMLIKGDYGWEVAHWLESGGVAPTSSYDTPQEAAARACQLLKLTDPVAPQDWPEIAQIGEGSSPPPKPIRRGGH